MKGELKSLTIENLIIPDNNDNSFKKSNIIILLYMIRYLFIIIAGNLSLKIYFENLSLIGQEEIYLSLEKFSFETKVLSNYFNILNFIFLFTYINMFIY